MRVARYGKNLVLLLVLASYGCGNPAVKAPVERRVHGIGPLPEVHVVTRGETLYGIAWSYGLDYRAVAVANGIRPPYVIYPGQRLRVGGGERSAEKPPTVAVQRRTGGAEGAGMPPPGAGEQPARTTPPETVSAQATSRESFDDGREVRWSWPTSGPIVSGFGNQGNKGMDIGGTRGQPIYAAAAGQVVYSGSGLIGYGKLIIVKHNKNYLSAYAHNDEILVGEGDNVARGQKIAQMGQAASGQAMLHFEIRKDGQPVNPLPLLPRSRPS